jgi:16S rRNA (guanine1207-N2)-methyltransferase
MSASRLSLAAEAGLFDPTAGRVLAVRPPDEAALVPLSPECTVVLHGFRPTYDRIAGAGWHVVTDVEETFDAAIGYLPREKARARAMIAEATRRARGPLVIDGSKTDGVESVLRDLRKRARVGDVISKGHGKIFAATDVSVDDWAAAPGNIDGFRIAAGLFSADGPDRGSEALAQVLPPLKGAVADLGAGWGYLSSRILTSHGVTQLHAVEAEHEAVDCLSANLHDRRVDVHWADARRWMPPAPLDVVVMNPPFHEQRKPDPSIGRAFIEAAGRMLGPRGELWMVANRHLPYEDALHRAFGDVREIEGDSAFKLIHARVPSAPFRLR